MTPNVRDALAWLVNLGCGVGKNGEQPEHGEFETAIEYGKDALLASAEKPSLMMPMSDKEWDAVRTVPWTDEDWRDFHGHIHVFKRRFIERHAKATNFVTEERA